jgi:hypothetical protein
MASLPSHLRERDGLGPRLRSPRRWHRAGGIRRLLEQPDRPGTVSGHNPPTGKHANIIGGSISDQDVQNLHFVPLTLKNGWVGNCFGSGVPAIAESVEGVVRFRGDMCRQSGSSANPFAVPPSLRPTKTEWLTTDEASASTGRIVVDPSGQVAVDSDPDNSLAAAGFTSLAGVSYTLPY